MRYFLSSISSPYSKYRVAVTVDQAIIISEITPPNRLCKSRKIAIDAKNKNGKSEYPKMLIVLYSSTYCPFLLNKLMIKYIPKHPDRPNP